MVNTWKYRSTIKSRPFFYLETKKLATLLLQGLNDYEIRMKVVDENIFQSTSLARRREIASTIIKRLKILDEYMVTQLNENSVETSKCIVLYSIMKTDRLFYEFMHEVIYENIITLNMKLTEARLNQFFESKKLQSETVSSWTDYTHYKLKQVYKRILTEAGLLNRKGKELYIIKPIIDPNVIEHIKKTESVDFIPIIFGGDFHEKN